MYRSLNRRRRVFQRGGFTLTELLVVILILALLISLLLPAINGALRTARNAAVSAEINQLAQALANFKSKYGDYPPSRILLCEDGDYSAATVTTGSPVVPSNNNNSGLGDITLATLAQRSLASMRKFFPRATFSTNGTPVWGAKATTWYDFNGNGNGTTTTAPDPHYILSGHECLVFFLGGIPNNDNPTNPSLGNIAMTGFAKDPTNPFVSSTVSSNRTPPLFEFNGTRLFTDPNNTSMNGNNPGIPGYYDSLGNAQPNAANLSPVNFYAYFSSYGNNGYDPNDVNFYEQDANLVGPNELYYTVGFPVQDGSVSKFVSGNTAESQGPNPYTNTITVPTTATTVTYLNPQSFQIISAGTDGLYGVGGQYVPNGGGSTGNPLPFDATNTYTNGVKSSDTSLRVREQDNLTNIKSGTLR